MRGAENGGHYDQCAIVISSLLFFTPPTPPWPTYRFGRLLTASGMDLEHFFSTYTVHRGKHSASNRLLVLITDF